MKDSRGLNEDRRWRRKEEQKSWEGREVFKEAVWEDVRFLKAASEIPDYLQQNHANKKGVDRVGRAYGQQGFRKFQLTKKFLCEEQDEIEQERP